MRSLTFIERFVGGVSRWFEVGKLTFGLREALILSIAGIAIASIVAYHYAA